MTETFVAIDGAGRAVVAAAMTLNAQTAVLLAVAAGADWLLARRVAAWARLLFYLPVLARALVPQSATWAVPGWRAPAPEFTVAIGPRVESIESCNPQAAPLASITGPMGLLGVYAVGVSAILGVQFRRGLALRRVLRQAACGVGDVCVSPDAGPMVVGVLRPRIVIPAWLTGSAALPLILAHERAHVARRDPVLAWGLRLLCTFAWPVLPVWIAASRIRGLMEHACDDEALRVCGGRTKETLMKYAETMIDIAARARTSRNALAFGASLRSRVAALRPSRRWPRAVQAGLAAAIPAMLLACSAASPEAAYRPMILAPAAGQIAPAPELPEDARVISVTILGGHPSIPGVEFSSATPEYRLGTRESILTFTSDDGVIAAPKLMVNPGVPAEIKTERDGVATSLRFTVIEATPGATRLSAAYTESDYYTLAPTAITVPAGQAVVIRIPGGVGVEPRTLIVTVYRPEETMLEGC